LLHSTVLFGPFVFQVYEKVIAVVNNSAGKRREISCAESLYVKKSKESRRIFFFMVLF